MVVMKGFVMVSDRPISRRYKDKEPDLDHNTTCSSISQIKPSNLIPIIKVTADDRAADDLSTTSELRVPPPDRKKSGSRVSIYEGTGTAYI